MHAMPYGCMATIGRLGPCPGDGSRLALGFLAVMLFAFAHQFDDAHLVRLIDVAVLAITATIGLNASGDTQAAVVIPRNVAELAQCSEQCGRRFLTTGVVVHLP